MKNSENINEEIYKILGISKESKIYYSNIWYIIVSNKWDYVYKIYTDKIFYDNEISAYNLLSNINIIIPKFYWLWLINNYFILKLENIRKNYQRKNEIKDFDLNKIAKIFSKIHNIKKNWKNFILWDIHSSNFYEINNWKNIDLWIFDFSSSKYWEIEEDIADIYIDLWIEKKLLNIFLKDYELDINYEKLYKFTINELYERIKNWMNLEIDKRKKYYKFILKLKLELKLELNAK